VDAGAEWELEHFDTASRNMVRFRLLTFPCRIGRRSGLELTLLSPSISSVHAEIDRDGSTLLLRDLESTNGTFCNKDRVTGEPVAIAAGDILHFASLEFRLVRAPESATTDSRGTQALSTMSIQADLGNLIRDVDELKRLITTEAIQVVYQPIVELSGRELVALEALGRGTSERLDKTPFQLFKLAESIGLERDLSQLFRRTAVAAARRAGVLLPLFVNIHPTELEGPGLLEELQAREAGHAQPPIVLEISEHFGGRPDLLRSLRAGLDPLAIRVAYDDFGAGLARINELAEAPAHFLKFDAALVSGIDSAGEAKRKLVRALVAAARELDMVTLAEGIETEGESRVCAELGFELGQGYLFGRPAPLDAIDR